MTMRIDFAKFVIPHNATNDELRDWINELYTIWADTSDLLTEYQDGEYVKVVRCRDCKFRCFGECTRIDEGFKDYWFAINPDGFCAWGERKVVGE